MQFGHQFDVQFTANVFAELPTKTLYLAQWKIAGGKKIENLVSIVRRKKSVDGIPKQDADVSNR